MSLCCKCNVIVNDNILACAGECPNIIHFNCAGIKKQVYDAISQIPNFFWRCTDCIDFYNVQKLKTDKMVKAIDSINAALLTLNDASFVLNDKIDKIIKPLPLQSPSFVSQKKKIGTNDAPSRNTRSNKSNEITCSSKNGDSSSLLSTTSTNSNNELKKKIIIGSGTLNSTLRTVEPLKWIFISRLHKDIHDDDLIAYIKNTFNISQLKLVRMQRKMDDDNRDYISFKIGVPENYFNQILDSSSWPSGVLIKEFINYRQISSNRFLVPRSENVQIEIP